MGLHLSLFRFVRDSVWLLVYLLSSLPSPDLCTSLWKRSCRPLSSHSGWQFKVERRHRNSEWWGGVVEKKAAHWRQFVCDLHFLKHRRHWSKTQDVISTEWDLLSLPSLCSLARSGGYGGFNHKHSHCVMPGKIMLSLGLVSHSSALIWLNHSLLITSILYAASFKCFSAEVTDFMGVGMPQNIRHLGI